MKITKEKIKRIIKAYAPEGKSIRFQLAKDKTTFTSFIGEDRIEYPLYVNEKMENYSRHIVLICSILHEVGHLITTGREPSTFHELKETEAKAQKWAIKRAMKLRLKKVAQCLTEEFYNWQEEIDMDEHTTTNPLYSLGNPYAKAYEENEEWIEKKMNEVFT